MYRYDLGRVTLVSLRSIDDVAGQLEDRGVFARPKGNPDQLTVLFPGDWDTDNAY